ncbi:carboxylating nicotinate-nucleotide diphosphorylase [Nakamurella flavida]|uniref:Nicotinate-nucleotide pyrophosphorylase [carboxylating] n=1 Tax=Nakamurella flavida TaxID=363630 RepID=A0A938YJ69_9ACTN|nr:carboxylating nicotinate-nucleotide diphosphorylase [Nakamurella flavida]MBM9476109.1 carboxylating nicotinate-nucleotide diphosphorylase [Nakamurella flavida]MDP9777146.1 nicotinate-nucleotide pyrophosphorylase (carboxylating) [Nakamurella flavida]
MNTGTTTDDAADRTDTSGRPGPGGFSPATVAALARAGLDPADVARVVAVALAEDLRDGPDVTTMATVPVDLWAEADLTPREPGVIAGVAVVMAVFDAATDGAVRVEALLTDGDRLVPGEPALRVQGPARAMLTAERTALNLLTHLSGIATATRAWVDAVAGTDARVRDTRKTLPGLRALEKYAVRCGGGVNHRMSLGDAALIKDNHVMAAGSVRQAIAAVRSLDPHTPLEVEVDTLQQLDEALAEGVPLVLLDNFSLADTREAVRRAAARSPRIALEASGGLTLRRAAEVAATGVDYIAVGALTHSAPALDLGLDLRTSLSPAR